ncbi:hypothetical protein [Reinekea marinisedimentorum]|uniref:Uncharacterized protein n=1 Tax=Reinekea marinisedimentorum TaxID=230495 RepID=A0A4R3I856_9GAMM|nr:hypothetical protein [Reinekea marinisedimentorum]TCS42432.1 hypothetical protein BCF53_10393 [Reinekea marinisedimentorum]
MSRSKKSRRMKGKAGIKTGSKKDFIKEGELGKIPSHNRLAKHKKKQKSAYQRYLEENNLKDTTSGQNKIRERLKKAEETHQTADIKPEKKEKQKKDFNQLSGDELLDMFN